MNKLCRIYRWPPRIFFRELNSGELICVCAPPSSISNELYSMPHQIFWQWQSPNLVAMSCHFSIPGSIATICIHIFFDRSLFFGGGGGCLLIGGITKFHLALKPVQQTMTFCFPPLLSIVTFWTKQQSNIHCIYTKHTLSIYRKGLCIFFAVLKFA